VETALSASRATPHLLRTSRLCAHVRREGSPVGSAAAEGNVHAATQAGAVKNSVNLGLLRQVTSSLTKHCL